MHELFLKTISDTNLRLFFRGTQISELVIIKPVGKPLPFSFDILSSAFQYGNRCFTKYPTDMPDYFKQAFPDGMSYERSFLFEDGGVATASWNIRYKYNFFYGIQRTF